MDVLTSKQLVVFPEKCACCYLRNTLRQCTRHMRSAQPVTITQITLDGIRMFTHIHQRPLV